MKKIIAFEILSIIAGLFFVFDATFLTSFVWGTAIGTGGLAPEASALSVAFIAAGYIGGFSAFHSWCSLRHFFIR